MLFWVGIFIAGLFAWLGFRLGFYETLAVLFNVVIAVYVAIFVGPVIIDFVPAAGETAYATILAVASTGIGTFLVLQCISYTFITSAFAVTFPKILDSLGAVILGFGTGFLVWSFTAFLVYLSPISEKAIAKTIGFNTRTRQTFVSNICWWCDIVHNLVGTADTQRNPRNVLAELLAKATQNKHGQFDGTETENNHPGTDNSIEPLDQDQKPS